MRAERRGKGCRVRSSLPFLSAHLSTRSPMAHPSACAVIPTMAASASICHHQGNRSKHTPLLPFLRYAWFLFLAFCKC